MPQGKSSLFARQRGNCPADAARDRAEQEIEQDPPAERQFPRDRREQKERHRDRYHAADQPPDDGAGSAYAEKAPRKDGEHLDDLVDGRDDGRPQRTQLDDEREHEHRREREHDRKPDAFGNFHSAGVCVFHRRPPQEFYLSLCGRSALYAHNLRTAASFVRNFADGCRCLYTGFGADACAPQRLTVRVFKNVRCAAFFTDSIAVFQRKFFLSAADAGLQRSLF